MLEILKDDYESDRSYDTDLIESLVAHEMGHNAHIALALKRANIPYGIPLTPIQYQNFSKECFNITKQIYEITFTIESKFEIWNKCSFQLGTMAINPKELIAQSFGNYYFGKSKLEIAQKIVSFFKKELT